MCNRAHREGTASAAHAGQEYYTRCFFTLFLPCYTTTDNSQNMNTNWRDWSSKWTCQSVSTDDKRRFVEAAWNVMFDHWSGEMAKFFVEKARGIWMIYYVPAGVRQVRLASPAAAGRLPPELLLLLVVLLLLLLPPGSWSKGRSAWLVLLLLTVALLLLSMAATAAGDLLPPSLHPSRPGERPLFLPIGAPPPTTGGNLCNFMRK